MLLSVCADGTIQHWHATSGKCLQSMKPDKDNHLYCVDYNVDGSNFVVAGRDMHLRVYDEATKSLV